MHFVRIDLEWLRAVFQVEECYLPTRLFNPYRIWEQVGRADLVFGWFASWHTFLPVLIAKLKNKPSIIVTGGYDVALLPEAGYGHQRGGLKRMISKWILRNSDCLLPFSRFSAEEVATNVHVRSGALHVAYLGVPDTFGSIPEKPREPMVLTVGNVDKVNLFRKGHEPFVRAATLIPEVPFTLAGRWKDTAIDHLQKIASPNLRLTGLVSEEDLLSLFRGAWVYVQASLHEGFGMSVAEAMLAGCIPVVTRNGSLPEVVGDTGIFAKSNRPEDVAAAVAEVLTWSAEARTIAGKACRERIIKCFPMIKRREIIEKIIKEMLFSAVSIKRTAAS